MLDATGEVLKISLVATDLHGTPITQVTEGESFLVKAYVDDRRGEPGVVVPVAEEGEPEYRVNPHGIFSAFFNVTYNKDGFDYDSSYTIPTSPSYPSSVNPPGHFANTSIDGFIQDLGLVRQDDRIAANAEELLSFRMIAQAPGVYAMDQGIVPRFNYEFFKQIDGVYPYEDGLPVLSPLVGEQIEDYAEIRSSSLYFFGQLPLTEESQVYFEGANLEVLAAEPKADFEVRYVLDPTLSVTNGEISSFPENADSIDEWEHFYVEIYAKSPSVDNGITGSVIELTYDAADFSFVEAIDNSIDSRIRYSVTFSSNDVNEGKLTVGFNTVATNVGDNAFGLIGRIHFRSLMELPVDFSEGDIASTQSSEITLTNANATIYNPSSPTGFYSVIDGETASGHSFEVWPVLYDIEGDRRVGLGDFAGFVTYYDKLVADTPAARLYDYDNNGRVGLSDFSFFVLNYDKRATQNSSRIYDDWYYDQWEGNTAVPLMGSSFLIEGEPVQYPSTSSPNSDATDSIAPLTSQSPTETSNFLIASYPTSSPTASPGILSEDVPEETPSELDQTTLQPTSTLDDQSELIVLVASSEIENSTEEGGEIDYTIHADEVLAHWEDDSDL